MKTTPDNTRKPIVTTWLNKMTNTERKEILKPVIVTDSQGNTSNHFYQDESGAIIWPESVLPYCDVTKYWK